MSYDTSTLTVRPYEVVAPVKRIVWHELDEHLEQGVPAEAGHGSVGQRRSHHQQDTVYLLLVLCAGRERVEYSTLRNVECRVEYITLHDLVWRVNKKDVECPVQWIDCIFNNISHIITL